MKRSKNWFIFCQTLIACFTIIASCSEQKSLASSFQNLGFESAEIGMPVNFMLPASDAMPGWATNNYAAGYVIYGTIALDSVCISIHDGHSGYPGDFNPLQGNYSIALQDGLSHGTLTNAYISQHRRCSKQCEIVRYSSPTYRRTSTNCRCRSMAR